MFTLRTVIMLIVYGVVLYGGWRIEKQLAARNSGRAGLILPVLSWLVAIVLSVNNFRITFEVQFSLLAFVASLMLFVFFSVPAMFFSILYVEGRQQVRERRENRGRRVRQARTQQRAKSSLDHRHSETDRVEPVVYTPRRDTKTAGKNQDSPGPRLVRDAASASPRRSASKKDVADRHPRSSARRSSAALRDRRRK